MATGYNRVYNTVLSGNEAQSSLSGNDVRMLEFDAALKRRPAVSLAVAGTQLSVQDWMQASVDSLLIDATAATGGANVNITLGPDEASQAAAYVSLFDLRSTNEQRLLRIVLQTDLASYENGNNVILKNTGSSHAHVEVLLSGGSAAATQNLFISKEAAGANCAGALPGLERLVVVSATNLNSGAEAVQFNVLSGSL